MSVMFPRFDPWSELASLHSTMDRIFGNFFTAPERSRGEAEGHEPTAYLPVNVTEGEAGYELEAPVPGHAPEDIEVTFADGLLTIKAERRHQQTTSEGQAIRREFFWGNSVRQLSLSGDVDPDKIEASVENGLLTVRVPKAAAAQPRRIQIGSGPASQARLVGSSSS